MSAKNKRNCAHKVSEILMLKCNIYTYIQKYIYLCKTRKIKFEEIQGGHIGEPGGKKGKGDMF